MSVRDYRHNLHVVLNQNEFVFEYALNFSRIKQYFRSSPRLKEETYPQITSR